MSRWVIAGRVLHGTITVLFLACIGRVYLDAARRELNRGTAVALGALAIEGVLVGANGGDCPLGGAFQRIGDDTPFFELVLPPRAAKCAVPVLGAVTAAGVAALAIRRAH